jgi:HSP20 family molecular chaperone IbpA
VNITLSASKGGFMFAYNPKDITYNSSLHGTIYDFLSNHKNMGSEKVSVSCSYGIAPDKESYQARFVVPGYKKEDISVQYSGGRVVISGKLTEDIPFVQSTFSSSLPIDADSFDVENMEVSLANGILSLRAKVIAPKQKSFSINIK